MTQQIENLKFIHIQIEEQIAVIEINNPPVNALTADVLAELSIAIDELSGSNEVRAAIITGVGNKFFVAGADIKQFPSLDEAAGKQLVKYGRDIFDRLNRLDIPVICAVNGLALGGGCELALACDIRIAAPTAKFGLPEVGLGIIPGYGGTQRLPRLVGEGKAKEMIFSGEPVTAEEAYRIGLVEKLAGEGESVEVAKKLARTILTKGPIAIATAKRVINEGLETTLQEGLELESDGFGQLCKTEDKNEGALAFLEKRTPQFTGK